MPYERGQHVIADIGRWLGWDEMFEETRIILPGKVVKVASGPDWTYSVQLDNAPVIIPGGKELSLVEGLREDQLTAEPEPSLKRGAALGTIPPCIRARSSRPAFTSGSGGAPL